MHNNEHEAFPSYWVTEVGCTLIPLSLLLNLG